MCPRDFQFTGFHVIATSAVNYCAKASGTLSLYIAFSTEIHLLRCVNLLCHEPH
jgi:hypothetical protein